MKIHANASVKRQLVSALRSAGADVTSQYEIDPTMGDDAVLVVANDSEAILLTEDKDFGELVFRDRMYARGVVLVRSDVTDAVVVAAIAKSVMAALPRAEGAFATITASEVRRRPIKQN